MAASSTERSWCVLEFARCNSFVAVQRAFRRQFGRRDPPETSIRRWFELLRFRGCICNQGKGRAGRPSFTEETVDRVRETFTRSPRKSVRRASRELKARLTNSKDTTGIAGGASTPQLGTSHKTCLRGFGGNRSIAWTSAVSHVGRTSNAFKVTMKLQTFLFQIVVTTCISVQYL